MFTPRIDDTIQPILAAIEPLFKAAKPGDVVKYEDMAKACNMTPVAFKIYLQKRLRQSLLRMIGRWTGRFAVAAVGVGYKVAESRDAVYDANHRSKRVRSQLNKALQEIATLKPAEISNLERAAVDNRARVFAALLRDARSEARDNTRLILGNAPKALPRPYTKPD